MPNKKFIADNFIVSSGTSSTFLKGDGSIDATVYAPLVSPAFSGTPTAPTAPDGTTTTQVATTAFVQNTVGGYLDKTGLTGGTITLTDAEVSNATIALSGVLTANLTVNVPITNKRLWAIYNNTTGAFTVTIKTAAGSGVTVAQTKRNLVYTDGVNVLDAFTDFESIAITGIPTAPTAAVNTNTTQLATTAFVNAEIANDAPTKTGGGASGTWPISITGNAGTVTTNANLTGEVTSTGNATTVTNAAVISKVLTGLVSTAGTVSATDSILQAIGKLNGNDGLKANLTSPAFSGTPTAPTAPDGTTTTQVATTAFVQNTVGGYLDKTGLTGGTITLTDLEVSNATIALSGVLTANLIVNVPITNKRLWAIYNNTTGAFTVTIKTAAGSGVAVAQTKRNLVYTDGVNVLDAFTDFESIAITGIPTAPTAGAGTNTTQLATTAFVTSAVSTHGAGTVNTISKWTGTTAQGNSQITDNGTGVGIGAISPVGKLDLNTGSVTLSNIAGQLAGSLSFGNIASTTQVPSIIGKSTTGQGLYLIGATAEGNTNPDLVLDIRENDGTDFTGFTSTGFRFSRFGNALIDILRNGSVGIGTTTPKGKLQVFGDIVVADGTGTGVIRGNNNDFGTGGAIKISSSNTAAQQYIQLGRALSGPGTFNPVVHLDVSNSNVGIGTTATTAQLHIKDGTGILVQGSNAKIKLSDTVTGMALRMDNSGDMQIVNNVDTALTTFTQGGNVGIGVAAPTSKLQVLGSNNTNIVFAQAALTPTSGVTAVQGIGLTQFNVGSASNPGYAVNGINVNDLSTLGIVGQVPLSADTGTIPAVTLVGNQLNNAGASAAVLVTRPVLGINNFSTRLMTVLPNGNIGIGTASPSSKLVVSGGKVDFVGTDMNLSVLNVSAKGCRLAAASGSNSFTNGTVAGDSILIAEQRLFLAGGNSTTPVVINANGSMLIGKTTDDLTNDLQVQGTVAISNLIGPSSAIAPVHATSTGQLVSAPYRMVEGTYGAGVPFELYNDTGIAVTYTNPSTGTWRLTFAAAFYSNTNRVVTYMSTGVYTGTQYIGMISVVSTTVVEITVRTTAGTISNITHPGSFCVKIYS